jgi:nucleoside 2-deoxyribosyltransferase
MNLKIYVAGIMSGCSFKEVKDRFYPVVNRLTEMGFLVLHPLLGKEKHYRDDTILKPTFDRPSPFTTNNAITRRDHWMVHQCDIIWMSLLGAEEKSLGCAMEIAWAYDNNKHIITLMEKDNCHKHAFITGCSDIILDNVEDGLKYLNEFSVLWKKD